ncbi:hypothetical protein L1987_06805 [Smallanthus sonchifolius]|uniref:Uncharacterized protein n=1 Tax=Smallanthus sonchifolius TaxID=185202 RepID=A0ACB9JZD1_9ASTR|nr:hypothetical protein L1987_06805 [Smallanthus sonchifolius]
MSSARSHANSADNNTEEPSEHSNTSRGTSASRSLSIYVSTEPIVAVPPSNLRSQPITRRTWPQGMSPPRQTQPQQPQQPPQLPSPRQHQSPLREIGGPSVPMIGIPVGRLPPGSLERDYLTVERVCRLHDQGFEHEMHLHHHRTSWSKWSASCMASSSDSSADESGYVVADYPFQEQRS